MESPASKIMREVRKLIERIVSGEKAQIELETSSSGSIPIHDILPDVDHFRRQLSTLHDGGAPPLVVYLHDRDPIDVSHEREIPVTVKFPNLQNIRFSIEAMLQAIQQSKLKSESVSEDNARTIFSDRLSDFIVSRAIASGGSILTDTIIDSKRSGDTVLCAMGYFYSTGTACGTSTPATVKLLPGRYSFGILNGNVPDFENTVWAIPTANGHVTLSKP